MTKILHRPGHVTKVLHHLPALRAFPACRQAKKNPWRSSEEKLPELLNHAKLRKKIIREVVYAGRQSVVNDAQYVGIIHNEIGLKAIF